MKRIICVNILLIAGAVSTLLFYCCSKKDNPDKNPCSFEHPDNVKPIDWNNYNSCYDVYYNYYGDCSDYAQGLTGKIIQCYGWIFVPKDTPSINPYLMCITSDPINASGTLSNTEGVDFYFGCNYSSTDTIVNLDSLMAAVTAKLDTCDLTKTCYIKGELRIENLPTNDCCRITPMIVISSADDINFE